MNINVLLPQQWVNIRADCLFFNLVMAGSIGDRKLWIQTNFTSLKNWPCIEPYSLQKDWVKTNLNWVPQKGVGNMDKKKKKHERSDIIEKKTTKKVTCPCQLELSVHIFGKKKHFKRNPHSPSIPLSPPRSLSLSFLFLFQNVTAVFTVV